MTKIIVISDLHRYYPKLEGGDLLIIGGDLTARDTYEEYVKFDEWILNQNFLHKIVIAGNHDNLLETKEYKISNAIYLLDSSIELMNLKIFGSP